MSVIASCRVDLDWGKKRLPNKVQVEPNTVRLNKVPVGRHPALEFLAKRPNPPWPTIGENISAFENENCIAVKMSKITSDMLTE